MRALCARLSLNSLIVVREFRELRDWAYRTALPLLKFPNFPKFPNKKNLITANLFVVRRG